ncbi:MAG: cysteine--tRNA ligase [Candidatus Paceibacterota bacterium]|jgi:cysteinyl-tRNA synthetase
MINLYNTLTKKKEEFNPITPNVVGMYSCGPTVYDYAHIGNLRSFLLSDIIRRVFEYNDYSVHQVINITDVGIGGDNDEGEDKIIRGLKRENKPITLDAMGELTDFYTVKFNEDLTRLNIRSPHELPRASEHIAEDITLIKTLEQKGFTYITSDGIYFNTAKYPAYGKLGGTGGDESRIGLKSEKKNAKDFAIWKFNPTIGYESPWGKGFPGWHIECSAMSERYLGEHFDIHTGGMDLAPIHHNNEIAQSECAHNQPFVNYWLHNAFITVESGKMAKSEGTGTTLNSLVEKNIHPLAYRYWLLSGHYRSPMTFSFEVVEGAHTALERIVGEVARLKKMSGAETGFPDTTYIKEFEEKIDDDLDTPSAIALLYTVINSRLDPIHKLATIQEFDLVLGLKLSELADEITKDIPTEIIALGTERVGFRIAKDWKKSDEIRDEIEKLGYNVRDYPDGTSVIEKKLRMLIN